MVHVYKNRKFKSKGHLVLYSHKEYLQLLNLPKWSRLHMLARPDQVIYHFLRSVWLRKKLRRVRDQLPSLKIGVHWGFLVTKPIDGSYADFHLADNIQTDFISGCCHQGFQSRDFVGVDQVFHHKPWDMITVSHNSRRKKLDDLLEEMIKIAEFDKSFTALLIVNTPNKEFYKNSRTRSVGFVRAYNQLPADIKSRVVLCRLSHELQAFGVSQLFIRKAMRDAESFVLASENEGNAKVVAEAVVEGCSIIGSRHLKGETFSCVESHKLTLLDGIKDNLSAFWRENSSSFEPPNVEVAEKVLEFADLISSHGVSIPVTDDFFVSLDKRLPALYPGSVCFPDSYDKLGTYDLQSLKSWRSFFEFIST